MSWEFCLLRSNADLTFDCLGELELESALELVTLPLTRSTCGWKEKRRDLLILPIPALISELDGLGVRSLCNTEQSVLSIELMLCLQPAAGLPAAGLKLPPGLERCSSFSMADCIESRDACEKSEERLCEIPISVDMSPGKLSIKRLFGC
mmetsp:Transcript_118331/g.217996  ORF Transcript_118331/g.217996 Transcript_118331/m.217996 type:complete len:150 (-) Transcript_118331:244-693(-)